MSVNKTITMKRLLIPWMILSLAGYSLIQNAQGQPGHGGPKDSCQAGFFYGPHPIQANRVVFSNISTGSFNQVYWDFGDSNHSHQMNPQHLYSQPGIYYACLSISSNDTLHPCSDTFCDSVYVGIAPPPCNADFTAWPSPSDPLQWIFHDQSQGNINQWNWDFGDGSTSVGPLAQHQFADTGQYLVCLIVTGSGCNDTLCQWINVSTPGNHNLAGQVFTGPFPSEGAIVQLFRKVGGQYMLDRSTITDSLGVFWFYQALGGQYLLRARALNDPPGALTYLPTYFPSDLHWFMADEILLNQDFFAADIQLKSIPPGPGGSGSVAGQVIYSDDRPDSLSGPAAGIDVFLINQNGNPSKHYVTDAQGMFQFSQASFGNLKVHAEVPGIQTIPAEIQLNQNNPSVSNILLEIQPMMVLPVNNLSLPEYSVGELFPNPTRNTAHISIGQGEPGEILIEVYDCAGVLRARQTYEHFGAEALYPLPGGPSSPGLYLVRIIMNQRYIASRRLIIAP